MTSSNYSQKKSESYYLVNRVLDEVRNKFDSMVSHIPKCYQNYSCPDYRSDVERRIQNMFNDAYNSLTTYSYYDIIEWSGYTKYSVNYKYTNYPDGKTSRETISRHEIETIKKKSSSSCNVA